ncbi:MAG: hypothetical protein K8R88_14500 [Armatimonadetes bacterium]|nr:hypothetical protein [Armatimonadota bacterium]
MNILIIGGTIFVGRHIAEAALRRGHNLTILHRGQRGADLFPGVERILCDRDGGLDALGDRTWDAVIDTCAYVPRVIAQSVSVLQGKANRYLFISTISVYTEENMVCTEDSEVRSLEDETVEEITGDTYGGLKVLCEKVLNESWGTKATIVRPGLIIGPWDSTDRFTYWIAKGLCGRKFIAPGPKGHPAQGVDGRDLADFCITLLENNTPGTFNAVGVATPLSDMIDLSCSLAGVGSEPVWVDGDRLKELGVEPWKDLPFWIGKPSNFDNVPADGSRAAGLVNRPVADTIRDTIAWFKDGRPEGPLKVGMDDAREAEILALLV